MYKQSLISYLRRSSSLKIIRTCRHHSIPITSSIQLLIIILYYPFEWMKVRSSIVLFPPESIPTSLKNRFLNTLGKDVLLLVQIETISAIQYFFSNRLFSKEDDDLLFDETTFHDLISVNVVHLWFIWTCLNVFGSQEMYAWIWINIGTAESHLAR